MSFIYLLYFIIAFFFTYILTPIFIKLSYQKSFGLSYPDERKVHSQPVPQIGGIAIYTSFILTLLIASSFNFIVGAYPEPSNNKVYGGIICAATFIFILGLIDDLYNLPAKLKLLGQIIAALILLSFGIKILFITNPAGGMVYLGKLGIILTIIWIVGITNAINLIDGLDGLAAGISLIASLIFFSLAYLDQRISQDLILTLSIIVAGTTLGFLRYNFYPAKIFMGDGGAYFLGLILSVITIIGAFKSVATLALFVPILVLGIPILDTLFSIGRRIKAKEPAFKPDRKHLHHKLLELGLSHRQTVLFIYLLSLILGLIAILLSR